MTKKLAALAAVLLLLLSQRPHAQAQAPGHAGIYFVDIGQGASTLIVSPTGKTLLVDGGPPGAGTSAVIPLLNTLGIATINYTVLTHYHIDHDGGLAEVINAGRVNGGIAYDNGDAANLVPPSLTSSTGTAYTAYKNALAAHGVTRQTINPGDVIDLGGGSDDPAFRSGRGRAQPAVDTVVFVGTGKWNGRSGYTCEARAADHGEPGRNRDIFSVVIKNSAGAVVATVNDTIDGGNIQSTRLQR
jgi:hypothetical protein